MKKAVKWIEMILAIVGVFLLLEKKFVSSERDAGKEEAEKSKTQFWVVLQWLKLKQSGRSISSYLMQKGYKTVAIYGMSHIGVRVLDELVKENIEVAYGIDKRAGGVACEINVLAPDDELPAVDAIIVSEPFYFEEIAAQLEKKINCPIVSIEEVVYESGK